MAKWMESWSWPKVVAYVATLAVVVYLLTFFKEDIQSVLDFVVNVVRAARSEGGDG